MVKDDLIDWNQVNPVRDYPLYKLSKYFGGNEEEDKTVRSFYGVS